MAATASNRPERSAGGCTLARYSGRKISKVKLAQEQRAMERRRDSARAGLVVHLDAEAVTPAKQRPKQIVNAQAIRREVRWLCGATKASVDQRPEMIADPRIGAAIIAVFL